MIIISIYSAGNVATVEMKIRKYYAVTSQFVKGAKLPVKAMLKCVLKLVKQMINEKLNGRKING